MPNAQITLHGNLTADPELRTTPGGDPVCSFAVAVNRRRRDEHGEWHDVNVSFWRCTAWRTLATNIAEHLRKGDPILVVGTIEQRTWENSEGAKQVSADVTAQHVGRSLQWVGDDNAAAEPAEPK